MELDKQQETVKRISKKEPEQFEEYIQKTNLKAEELSKKAEVLRKSLKQLSKNKIKSKPQKGKYNSKRLALGRIISSPFKTNVVEALAANKNLSASELFKKSGVSSEGTFHYHLRDLEWLGIVDNDEGYRLTDFGIGISDSLARLE